MASTTFDQLTRQVSAFRSRRRLLRGLPALVLSLVAEHGAVPGAGLVRAGKGKKKPRKLKKNAFGCVNVGGKCRGKDAVCCSGICQGKKPKKGKKDTSRCVGRNVLGCLATSEVCGGPVQSCGANGACFHTTGNAGFCGTGDGECFPCRTDAECDIVSGPGSACVICDNCSTPSQTACVPPEPAFVPQSVGERGEATPARLAP